MTRSARIAMLLLGSLMAGASAPAPAAISTERQHGAVAGASAEALVAAAIAGDEARLQKIATELKARPRPPRGDRPLARELNERGLALWRRQRFAEAVPHFKQAHQADASDAEIAENLGYALLRSDRVAEAERALLAALALAPERASAWGSLGLVRAKMGKHQEGVMCVLTAYRHARDPRRTLEVYSHLAESDGDPKVRAMLADVVHRLSSAQGAKRG